MPVLRQFVVVHVQQLRDAGLGPAGGQALTRLLQVLLQVLLLLLLLLLFTKIDGGCGLVLEDPLCGGINQM